MWSYQSLLTKKLHIILSYIKKYLSNYITIKNIIDIAFNIGKKSN